jgi:hypothetical protein
MMIGRRVGVRVKEIYEMRKVGENHFVSERECDRAQVFGLRRWTAGLDIRRLFGFEVVASVSALLGAEIVSEHFSPPRFVHFIQHGDVDL